MEDDVQDVDQLRLDAGGRWTVHSSSATVYRLDLDRGLLCREPGTGSSSGPRDRRWVSLVSVETYVVAADDSLIRDPSREDVITVGNRHLYLLDPEPGTATDYQWWLQRLATRISRDPTQGEEAEADRRGQGRR